jgi:hypothetical protein
MFRKPVPTRATLVALERDEVVAGAHLKRYQADSAVSLAGEVVWFVSRPANPQAGLALLAACRDRIDGWACATDGRAGRSRRRHRRTPGVLCPTVGAPPGRRSPPYRKPLPCEDPSVQSGDRASSVPDLLTADCRLGVAIAEDVAEAKEALETALAEVREIRPMAPQPPGRSLLVGGQFARGLTDPDARSSARFAGPTSKYRPTTRTPGHHIRQRPTPDAQHRRSADRSQRTRRRQPGVTRAREHVSIDDDPTATRALTLTALEHCGAR